MNLRFFSSLASRVLPACALFLSACGFGGASSSDGGSNSGTSAPLAAVDPDDALVAGFGGLPDATAHSGVFLDVIADPANSQSIKQPGHYVILVPAAATKLRVAIFDGNAGGLWDQNQVAYGAGGVLLPDGSVVEYKLSTGGAQTTLVSLGESENNVPRGDGLPVSKVFTNAADGKWEMLYDDLLTAPAAHKADAAVPGGGYRYVLDVAYRVSKTDAINGFKIAVDGKVQIAPASGAATVVGGFIGGVIDSREMHFGNIHPSFTYAVSRDHYPDLLRPNASINGQLLDGSQYSPAVLYPAPTDTFKNDYNGTFEIPIDLAPDVATAQTWSDFVSKLILEEGDADDAVDALPALPANTQNPGIPPDDGQPYPIGAPTRDSAGYRLPVAAQPSVAGSPWLEVVDPHGVVYPAQLDLSGNVTLAPAAAVSGDTAGWERVLIPSTYTFLPTDIANGLITWKIRIHNLDARNTWFIRSNVSPANPQQVLGEIGDRVWADKDGVCNGLEDPTGPAATDEHGVNLVSVRLFLSDNGNLTLVDPAALGTGATWANPQLTHDLVNPDAFQTPTGAFGNAGFYLFDKLPVPVGGATYVVQVDASNFAANGPLSGYSRTFPATDSATTTLTRNPVKISDRSLDFGYCKTTKLKLGDRVWKESDCNGVQNQGETGINGVTVRLFSIVAGVRQQPALATQVTAGDGNYLFDNLDPGTYEAEVDESTIPAGYTRTSPATNVWHKDLTADDLTNDFGYCSKIKLGDRVWKEADCNGVQNVGESGINGVTVRLFAVIAGVRQQPALGTQVTAGDGNYLFDNLPAGTYEVEVDESTIPAGYSRTSPATNVWHKDLTVDDLTLDFGYCQKIKLGDRVWKESDCNGIQNQGESGINGVTVRLFAVIAGVRQQPALGTQVTAGDGNYLFDNLPAGTYEVEVDESTIPAGYTRTSPATNVWHKDLTADDLTLDFGYCAKIKLGDRIWKEQDCNGVQNQGESGLNGVTVRLFAVVAGVRQQPAIGTQVTSGDGNYLFDALPQGTYEVEVDESTIPAGFTRTSPATNVWHKDLTADDLTLDFGYCTHVKIGDRIWKESDCNGVQDSGEQGLNGVTVRLFAVVGGVRQQPAIGTQVTAGDGNYLFVNLLVGTYEVEVDESTVPSGYVRTFPATNVWHKDLTADDLTADFGYCAKIKLGDRVWKEADCNGVQNPGETGINGVTVRLFAVVAGVRQQPALGTQVTTGDGNYLFDGLPQGTYEVEVDESTIPAGYNRTSPATNVWHKDLTADDLTLDFGYCSKIKIGDRIWKESDCNGVQDAGESGLNGVTVRLFEIVNGVRQQPAIGTAVTAGDGNYLFEDLPVGTYEVEVDPTTVPAGYFRTSPATNVWHKDLTADDLTNDFGYCSKIKLGDRIWKESDCNGVQDSGEEGLNGVTVNLYVVENGVRQLPALASTVTSGDGEYLFDGLVVATYEVEVDESTIPAGYARTAPATNVWHKDLTADDLTLDFGYCKKTCECQSGKVHELSLNARVWLADPSPSALDVYVKLDRGCPDCKDASASTMADLADFSMGRAFPGEQHGRNGLITVSDVRVVDGYAIVSVTLDANCPYFPEGWFDGDIHIEVTVNGVGEAVCAPVDCHCLTANGVFPCDWKPRWCDDQPVFTVKSTVAWECVPHEPCKPTCTPKCEKCDTPTCDKTPDCKNGDCKTPDCKTGDCKTVACDPKKDEPKDDPKKGDPKQDGNKKRS